MGISSVIEKSMDYHTSIYLCDTRTGYWSRIKNTTQREQLLSYLAINVASRQKFHVIRPNHEPNSTQ